VNQAKYINSPETPIFTKGRMLFGLDLTKREIINKDEAVIVEGQIDAIRLYESGIRNVVAPLGTAMTPDQAAMVRRIAKKAVLLYDCDDAGEKAAEKAFVLLAPLGVEVLRVKLPSGDPDSFLATHGAEAMANAINNAPCYVKSVIDSLSAHSPHEKVEACQRVGHLVSHLGERVLQDSLINQAAVKLGVTPNDITKHVRTAAKSREDAPEIAASRKEYVDSLICAFLSLEPARELWAATDWKTLAGTNPYAPTIETFLTGRYKAGNLGSISSWGATQDKEIEAIIVEVVDMATDPRPVEEVISDCYKEFRKESLSNRLEILKAKQAESPEDKEVIAEIAEVWAALKKD
jgi:DNA primase